MLNSPLLLSSPPSTVDVRTTTFDSRIQNPLESIFFTKLAVHTSPAWSGEFGSEGDYTYIFLFLFFLLMCFSPVSNRGGTPDVGVAAGPQLVSNVRRQGLETDASFTSEAIVEKDPTYTDMYIAYSTVEGMRYI